MKKLSYILPFILLFACKPIVSNNEKTLEKVFSMTEFDIEIQVWGCFGGYGEHFTIKKVDNNFLLQSQSTGKSHEVSQAKLDSLKSFLKSRIGKYGNGGFTTSQYIRLGSFFHSVDYEHNYYDGIESTIYEDLLGYSTLIEKDNFVVEESTTVN